MTSARQVGTDPITWVVGMDGSPGAEHALGWSVDAIADRATHLHIIRAWHQPVIAGVEYGVQVSAPVPETAYEGLEQLASDLDGRGVAVTSDVVCGGASSVLLTESQNASLLVLGSRGHGGFERLLLGSVSQQCATHARIPTVVVPADVTSDQTSGAQPPGRPPSARIVVGIDGSPAATAALDWALEFASDDDVVVAVGVWNPSTWSADVDDPLAEHRERRWHAEIDGVISEATATHSVTVERDHRRGSPAAMLLDAATEADLLVVGERGRRGFSAAVLGSVTTDALHHAPCPVAVIPAPELSTT